MALVVKDRVQETTTTTGTGTLVLLGATSGFQSFSAIGNGNTTYYTIDGGTEWEVGLGTYTSSGTTLSRDTILSSSNGGSAVNFSAGTKNVFVTYPADKAIYDDASGNVIALGTPASVTLTNGTGLPLTTGVTGTLPIANGGTGTTSTTFANLTTNVTGTLPVANGGTGTSTAFTTGSVVFAGASGTYTQDNANLFWDDTNNRLGIGTTSPTNHLTVNGSGRFYGAYTEDTTNTGIHAGYINSTPRMGFFNGTAAQNWQIDNDSGNFRWFTPGVVRMQLTSAGLDVNGTMLASGVATFTANQNVGTLRTSTGSLGGIECLSASSGNAAFMTFHRPGAYASYFGIDTDNYFAVGGWSAGAALANFKCNVLSKGSGSFCIDHPLPALQETHNLIHSFVEAPQADNLYRGKATLVNGTASVNIDEIAGMTEGTFVLLNREVQCFTSNESDWDAVRGSVNGNILTIECQNQNSTANISWLVIGERKDKHMYDTNWTDENGKVIVEPLKKTTASESNVDLSMEAK